MSLILDTSFLIALNDSGDSKHNNALSLKARIKNKEFGQGFISDYIFDEFVTFLRAKSVSSDKIKLIGDALLEDKAIELLKVDKEMFLISWDLFKKTSKLSFTDCSTITLSKEFGISHIASFDSDFDKVIEIKRLE